MAAGTFADASPAPVVLGALRADEATLALLAPYARPGDDLAARIAGVVRAPFPSIRVVQTPGGRVSHDLWVAEADLSIQAWGDTDGSPGSYALEVLLRTALVCVGNLDQREWQVWETIVTNVDVGPPFPTEDEAGRTYWTSVCGVTLHPPRDVLAAPTPPA